MSERFHRREETTPPSLRRRVQRAIASQQVMTGKADDRYAASAEKTRSLLEPFLDRLETIQEKLDRLRE